MIDSVLYLIGKTASGQVDEFLQPIETDTRTEVFATSVPVTRTEFYKAGELGFKPEFEFLINPVEYHGETEAEYTDSFGITHYLRIYRTYPATPDQLELYCADAAGLDIRPAPTPPTPEQNETDPEVNDNE